MFLSHLLLQTYALPSHFFSHSMSNEFPHSLVVFGSQFKDLRICLTNSLRIRKERSPQCSSFCITKSRSFSSYANRYRRSDIQPIQCSKLFEEYEILFIIIQLFVIGTHNPHIDYIALNRIVCDCKDAGIQRLSSNASFHRLNPAAHLTRGVNSTLQYITHLLLITILRKSYLQLLSFLMFLPVFS